MTPIRVLLTGALLAAAASATPAGAVPICADPAFPADTYVCVHNTLYVEAATVSGEVGWTCQIGPSLACVYRPFSLDKTGVDGEGVWFNGFRIDPCVPASELTEQDLCP